MPDLVPAKERITGVIGNPLGFFVLALLIVEGFLGAVLVWGRLAPPQMVVGMWAGISLYLMVVLAVFVLVWYKPQHLTYDKEAHLIASGKIVFGSDSHVISPEKRFEDKATEQ